MFVWRSATKPDFADVRWDRTWQAISRYPDGSALAFPAGVENVAQHTKRRRDRGPSLQA
jgi:hypothetical protein